MIGDVQESTWITVAAERDGQPDLEQLGAVTLRRAALFAYRAEAEEWLEVYRAAGYTGSLARAACSYFGPTDSPSNCWGVTVELTVASFEAAEEEAPSVRRVRIERKPGVHRWCIVDIASGVLEVRGLASEELARQFIADHSHYLTLDEEATK